MRQGWPGRQISEEEEIVPSSRPPEAALVSSREKKGKRAMQPTIRKR